MGRHNYMFHSKMEEDRTERIDCLLFLCPIIVSLVFGINVEILDHDIHLLVSEYNQNTSETSLSV